LTDSEIVKFQFVTLAGFHSLNFAMFNLASSYKEEGMFAYSQLQEAEFANEVNGYQASAGSWDRLLRCGQAIY